MKHDPKFLKETPEDKQFRQVLISLIGSIFLCIFCLVGTTWAWFETTITSTNNVITIGEMSVSVSLSKGGQSSQSDLTPSNQYTYRLEDVGTYTIVLTNNGNIAGYCSLRLTDATGATEEFTSGTLNPLENGAADTATISIEITAADNYNGILPVELRIEPHWGNDPVSAIQNVNENLFLPPTEATEPDPTEETTDSEDPEAASIPTDPSEATDPTDPSNATDPTDPPISTQPTEPEETTPSTEATEPEETQASTEPSQPPISTEATEPTSSTEATVPPTEATTPAATAPTEPQSRTGIPSTTEETVLATDPQ